MAMIEERKPTNLGLVKMTLRLVKRHAQSPSGAPLSTVVGEMAAGYSDEKRALLCQCKQKGWIDVDGKGFEEPRIKGLTPAGETVLEKIESDPDRFEGMVLEDLDVRAL